MSINSDILKNVVKPTQGNLPRSLAKYLLTLDFPSSTHKRFATLSKKAQLGKLTVKERTELDELLTVDTFLSVLQAKARTSLAKGKKAA